MADIESKLLEIGIPAEDIDRALESLNGRERAVIVRRCGFQGERPLTCEEIGRYYGITTLKIQQVENQALKKLKLWSEEDLKS